MDRRVSGLTSRSGPDCGNRRRGRRKPLSMAARQYQVADQWSPPNSGQKITRPTGRRVAREGAGSHAASGRRAFETSTRSAAGAGDVGSTAKGGVRSRIGKDRKDRGNLDATDRQATSAREDAENDQQHSALRLRFNLCIRRKSARCSARRSRSCWTAHVAPVPRGRRWARSPDRIRDRASRWLIVGGRTSSRMASTQLITSTLPAAAIRWPIMLLMLEIGIFYAAAPKACLDGDRFDLSLTRCRCRGR